MIGDIVGEIAGGVLKLRKLDPDGGRVVVAGLAFWVAVGMGIYAIKRQL